MEEDKDISQYIIGALAASEAYSTPANIMRLGDSLYFRGIDYERRCKNRERMLSAKAKDLKEKAELFEKVFEEPTICIFGDKDKLEAFEDFEELPLAL